MLGLRAAHRTVRTLGVGPVVLIHHYSNGPGAGGPGPGHALASRIFNKAESGQVRSGQVRSEQGAEPPMGTGDGDDPRLSPANRGWRRGLGLGWTPDPR